MGKVYGYCRISTKKQNIDRQVRNIRAAFPDAIIVKEIYTGTKFQGRNEMNKSNYSGHPIQK
uniref:recombinase family protein n=1 Tax=Acetatifactor sp. TaxID=1872090 RepID=UPI00405744B9